jgi:hypothetical protein
LSSTLANRQRAGAAQQPGKEVAGVLGAVLDDQHGHAEVAGQARKDLADGVQPARRGADHDQLAARHDRR